MGTYKATNPEPSGVTSEGHTGDLSSNQPQQRTWVGDTDPSQPTEADCGTTSEQSDPAASHAGVGPGPSGSSGPAHLDYGADAQTQGHG